MNNQVTLVGHVGKAPLIKSFGDTSLWQIAVHLPTSIFILFNRQTSMARRSFAVTITFLFVVPRIGGSDDHAKRSCRREGRC